MTQSFLRIKLIQAQKMYFIPKVCYTKSKLIKVKIIRQRATQSMHESFIDVVGYILEK